MSILDNQQQLAKKIKGLKIISKKPLSNYIFKQQIKRKIGGYGMELEYTNDSIEWIKTYIDKMETKSLERVNQRLINNGIGEMQKMKRLGKTKYIRNI